MRQFFRVQTNKSTLLPKLFKKWNKFYCENLDKNIYNLKKRTIMIKECVLNTNWISSRIIDTLYKVPLLSTRIKI